MNIIKEIEEHAKGLGDVKIMEVCGGHTNTVMKYGLREVLPENIKLISGPGCPVCVTSQTDIDVAIELALAGVPLASYGDMMNVPGTKMSLREAKAIGADVMEIYSVDQIPLDRVFFAVGFETTVPMTASFLEKGGVVYSAHKTMPEAMRLIVKDMKIDGFIDPGHVSTIIGSDIWTELNLGVPQVIAGFKPEQLMKATLELLKLIKEEKTTVVNEYPEVVRPQGNIKAQELINKHLQPADAEWRGLGLIKGSALVPRNDEQNAAIKYKKIINNIESRENPACRCGEVIKGLIEPRECALFGKVCTPSNPQGACMVSETEGACGIAFKYGKSLSEK